MKLFTMTLLQRLKKNEKELQKVRGCSPLTHGWQTQRFAKADRKWDYYAEIKQKLMQEKETKICKCENPVRDVEYVDMCGVCGDCIQEKNNQCYLKKNTTRGGQRKGAGRKQIEENKKRVTLNARIMPDTLARIDKNRGKLSRGKYIDSIINC